MKAMLWRTSSGQMAIPSLGSVSPRGVSIHDFGTGVSFTPRSGSSSPRAPLHFEVRDSGHSPGFRRVRSETDLSQSEGDDSGARLRQLASSAFPALPVPKGPGRVERTKSVGILEEDEETLTIGALAGMVTEEEQLLKEEVWFSGGGSGKGGRTGGRNGGGGGGGGHESSSDGESDQSRVGAYYKEMLKANPRNPLLLRNYGRYLHEVEKDAAQAEEYYGRAILESPGDGEVLSLYAKLIWDTHKDEKRAESYFDQAVKASPDDCYVLASYAHFLWDTEGGEEEEEEDKKLEGKVGGSSPLIAAY
ncbi:uncharacterized protein LOC116265219 [Nymphaea colorata]|nr:uncharacterized protein LOC116265219 [Nymphaea colorata]